MEKLKTVLNKISCWLLALSVVSLSFLSSFAGGEDASLITYSSEGPDCYADGSPVLDGEYYALVWQTEAAGDITFTLAGEAADPTSAVVLRALPRAKDGRLQSTTFAVDKAELPTLSATGVLRLYLLDTRVFTAGVASVGGLDRVQAAVPVTATAKVETKASSARVLKKGFLASAVPAETPSPRITGISLAGGEVVLTVADTVNGLNYTAVDPMTGETYPEAVSTEGRTGGEIQVKVPRNASSMGLFKVGRR